MPSTEHACELDDKTHLFGICSVPNSEKSHKKVGVVLLNAGFLHRVGPNRMNTELARKLAAQGFLTLRMDLSGLGDSMAREGAGDDYDQVSLDIDKAFEFLQQHHNINQFVLLGLCSGANDISQKAITDERVVGIVNIDGVGYRTPRFYINHFFLHILRRIFHIDRWKRLYVRYKQVRHDKSEGHDEVGRVLMSSLAYTSWTKDVAGRYLELLANRGVKMHFVYTGGASGYYNYHSQFEDIFKDYDLKGFATSRFFPEIDHLAMLQKHRQKLHNNVVTWIESSF